MLARCAGKDRYYPMIDTLFATQRDWVVQRPLQPLMRIAKQAGMSEDAFNECLKDQKILDGVNEVRERASKVFKVDSTPTFFINGKVYKGEATLDEFEKQLAPYLKS
jgi:protein-disulfide isomerase